MESVDRESEVETPIATATTVSPVDIKEQQTATHPLVEKTEEESREEIEKKEEEQEKKEEEQEKKEEERKEEIERKEKERDDEVG